MTGSLRTLLANLIDYAGLFPPAALAMPKATEEYNRCRVGEHEWMLGRFICPVSRLPEFEKHASMLMPGTYATSGYREYADTAPPWRLSAIVDAPLDKALDAIDAFNARHASADNGLAEIDCLEMKVDAPGAIDDALDTIPEDIFPFFEFPVSTDCRGFVASLAGEAAGAKIRTGGVVPAAFPTPREVAAFLAACASAEVPFKATAGLHHPVRASYRLTYEPDSASCVMHGFFNVFVAAAMLRHRKIDEAAAAELLADELPDRFVFSDQFLTWKGIGLETAHVAMVRETFALAFGSCSFDDPVADLRKLGLL